jgi:chromosome condensin MukBEF ATPase and DNA-binding subunit MukB
MTEIEHLENENQRKENQLKKMYEENSMIQDQLKFLKENKKDLIDDIEKMKSQNPDMLSLNEELNQAKTLTCERCDKYFGNGRDLRSHMSHDVKQREDLSHMKLRLHEIGKKILQ